VQKTALVKGTREAVEDPALRVSSATRNPAHLALQTLQLGLDEFQHEVVAHEPCGSVYVHDTVVVLLLLLVHSPPLATIASAFFPTSLLAAISRRRTSPVETNEMSYAWTSLRR